MIDIEKEKQALSDSNALGFDQEQNHYIQIGWMKCAESKQAEINDLKAQLERAKKDSKRIDFLSDKSQNVANVMLPTKIVERNVSSLRDAIDEAMAIEEIK